jgi:hypothetical protein
LEFFAQAQGRLVAVAQLEAPDGLRAVRGGGEQLEVFESWLDIGDFGRVSSASSHTGIPAIY